MSTTNTVNSRRLSPFPPSNVLIIGAGPSGLVSLRNLSVYGKFDNVTLYERRNDVGGVWYLDNRNPSPLSTTTSLSQDHCPLPPRWPSPAYPGLIGNVLPEYLSFSRFPFPTCQNQNQPFPTLLETHNYLRDFAEPFIKDGKIKLNIEVTRVEEVKGGGGWNVEVTDWNIPGGKKRVEHWDAVVIAVGWYDHPVWPDIPGLDTLREKGLAQHAKFYRGPQGYEDKRVFIVGNANSGNDIAAHLAPIAQTPVYQSIRRPAFGGFPSLPDDRIKMVSPVTRFELSSSETPDTVITAHLQDGSTIPNIDFIHIATGYKPNPDFIHVFNPSQTPNSEVMRLVDQNPQPETGTRIPSLHRHILYAYNPSLAFIGSPMSFTPFTIGDISSLWLSLIWSLQIPLLSPPTPPTTSRPSSPSSPACYLPSLSSHTNTLTSYLLQFESQRLDKIKEWRSSLDNPSALYSYGVLGASEEEYAESLRKDAVSVLGKEMDEWFEMRWAPEEERRMRRERMYKVKFEALVCARDRVKGEEGEREEGVVISG
ncbi:Thiol-specific monooxygenase [Leucoagaricus sp. SymC.cos]|nr:Thiol-specific monooxygenase [Leucoagaricus sp. SymC.cos]